MRSHIAFVFTDVHMGLSHDGLNEIVKSYKKKNPVFARSQATSGGLLLFVNKGKTKFKLFSEGGQILSYMKLRVGQPLDEETIEMVAKTFGGSFTYSSSVRNALKTLGAAHVYKLTKSARLESLSA